jgi:hypothetical protein
VYEKGSARKKPVNQLNIVFFVGAYGRIQPLPAGGSRHSPSGLPLDVTLA